VGVGAAEKAVAVGSSRLFETAFSKGPNEHARVNTIKTKLAIKTVKFLRIFPPAVYLPGILQLGEEFPLFIR